MSQSPSDVPLGNARRQVYRKCFLSYEQGANFFIDRIYKYLFSIFPASLFWGYDMFSPSDTILTVPSFVSSLMIPKDETARTTSLWIAVRIVPAVAQYYEIGPDLFERLMSVPLLLP